MSLAYGLNTDTRPEGTVAWGARLIWPNDLVWDRCSWDGEPIVDLMEWLNGGALKQALAVLAHKAEAWELRPSDNVEIPLVEDLKGVIVANPNGSHGYVYVAAWLLPTS